MNRVKIIYCLPDAKLSERRHDEGQEPSVDLTREPWGQPVRRWGRGRGGIGGAIAPHRPPQTNDLGGVEPLPLTSMFHVEQESIVGSRQ